MKAEIIAVGTELLLGQVVNTNAAFLSEKLAALGIEVYYQTAIGDNRNRLLSLLDVASSRSDLLVLCGGLGPTDDDLTRDVVAEFLGEELIIDSQAKQKIVDYLEGNGRKMTDNNIRQAQTIAHGQAIQNPIGLAVGTFYQSSTTSFLLLPGPPNELIPMFDQTAEAILRQTFPRETRLTSRVLRFYGIGEARLVTVLADEIANQTNPTIAPYAKLNEVTLRLTAKTTTVAMANQLLDELEQKIMAKVGDYFYGYGEQNSLVQETVALLKKYQQTITCAESITAGLCQSKLGSVAGVSSVFPGGFVVYGEQLKASLLQIDPQLLEREGTVSQACAIAMAEQARKLATTDYALSFTGVAGPTELEQQAVGTVWIALASRRQATKAYCYQFKRHRESIQNSAVMAGLDLLRRQMKQDFA